MSREDQLVLPTFVGIGPGRTGTTYLYEALLEHPEVTMARGTKETNFFNDGYHRGSQWYSSFFRDATTSVIGEISNNYFYSDVVASRMRSLIPNVRVITCLRNPYERLLSAYRYRLRAGTIPSSVSLDEAVWKYPDLVESNKYASRLAPFVQELGRNQLLILLYEDLLDDPHKFLRTVYSFIGVSEDFVPSIVDQRLNPTTAVRAEGLAYVVGPVARALRKFGFVGVLTRIKRSQIVRRLLFIDDATAMKSQQDVHLSPASVNHLKKAWSGEMRTVEEWLSTSLPSWHQPPGSMLT